MGGVSFLFGFWISNEPPFDKRQRGCNSSRADRSL